MAANVVFTQIVGGRSVLRFNANATVNVAANSTVNSDLAPNSNDQITGAAITKILWSTANTLAGITIGRGPANVILTLTGSGNWDLKSMGVSLAEFSTATIVVTMPDALSSLILECTKMYPTGSK
jgi:hypothetical protein